MLKIFLVRPGSTDYDEQGRIQGTLDVPLNRQGDNEVARLAGELQDRGISAVYCSQCRPALQTAEALASALDCKLKPLENMQNLNHGLWQGMKVDEVRRKQPSVFKQWQEEPECVCPPQGETLQTARERVDAALAKLLKKNKQGAIALVIPEPLGRLVRQQLTQSELGNLWTASLDRGRFETIDVQPAAKA